MRGPGPLVSCDVSGLINQHFGSHVVRELVGAGGAAEVYRVEHVDDSRSQAALKVLLPERQLEKRQVQALAKEFEVLSALSHPGIPKARRFGEVSGRSALLMDFIPGRTLASVLAEAPSRVGARALIGLVGIAAHLHEHGIVHNDLKPENVIVGPDGKISLVDFGNAREPVKTSIFIRFFSKPKSLFGTAAYLAPELITGHHPSFASDVYALGVCAFVVLTGSLPFEGHRTERLAAHAQRKPPALRERMPQAPVALAQIIDACLAKSPMSRPTDARALIGVMAHVEEFITPRTRRTRRHTAGSSQVARETRRGTRSR